jgi:hypothetical protein
MGDDPEVELAEAFGEIARTLLAEEDLAVDTIDPCEHCGITVVQGHDITSPASSDEVPAIVDRLQSETGEGPCVDAIREHEVFQTGDLLHEARWPEFARRASVESGIESILSFRLFVEGDTLGSLNLYSTRAWSATSKPGWRPARWSARPSGSSWPVSTSRMSKRSPSSNAPRND